MTTLTNVPRAGAAAPPARSAALTYTRFELLRAFRNTRFLVFSLAFPLLMFLLVAGPNRNQRLGGINFATYFMVGMLGWGSMTAVLGTGVRIAAERSINWHRQLRVTPLRARTYFLTKVLGGYALVMVSAVLLYGVGMAFGVRLSAAHWFELTGYLLVALLPFAVIGVLMGHLLTIDSIGAAIGGIASLFADPRRRLGPVGLRRLPAIRREVSAVVLARARREQRGRWGRLAGPGLDRHRGVDSWRHEARAVRVPPGHGPGLSHPAPGARSS